MLNFTVTYSFKLARLEVTATLASEWVLSLLPDLRYQATFGQACPMVVVPSSLALLLLSF